MAVKTSFLLFFLYFVCTVSAVSPPASFEGLLPNGDFEESPKATDMNKMLVKSTYGLPKWEINGLVEYIPGGRQSDGNYFGVAHGAHAVRLGINASISQTIPVNKGALYALTFATSLTCPQNDVLHVSAQPLSGSAELTLQNNYNGNEGDTFAWGFKAASNSVTIIFHNPAQMQENVVPACGPLIDVVAIKQFSLPKPTSANLVKNGGFEMGPQLSVDSSHGVLLPPSPTQEASTSPLPSWMIESSKAVKFIDSKNFKVPSGKYAVELVGASESAIAQIIRTVPNKVYRLKFVAGDAKNRCSGAMMVEVNAANTTMQAPITSKGKGEFHTFTFHFTATSARTKLTFVSSYSISRSDNFGYRCGPVLDQVEVLSIKM